MASPLVVSLVLAEGRTRKVPRLDEPLTLAKVKSLLAGQLDEGRILLYEDEYGDEVEMTSDAHAVDAEAAARPADDEAGVVRRADGGAALLVQPAGVAHAGPPPDGARI